MIDEKIIIRAIKSEQFDFLYWIYAANKNYEIKKNTEEDINN